MVTAPTLPNAEIIAVVPTVYASSAMGRGIGGQMVTSANDFVPIEVGFYPGGEPYIKHVPDNLSALIVRPRSMNTFMAALFFIEASEERNYPEFDLILPYVPGARQDRLMSDDSDMLFTIKSVANVINRLINIRSVKILDPHSDVTPALLDRCHVYGTDFIWGRDFYHSSFGYDGVIAPDLGAVRRAIKVAELMQVPEILQGWKKRDTDTGKLSGFGIQQPSRGNGHYLVVDDICDGGGTFLGLADEIDKFGSADLYVTHGIFSRGTKDLLGRYKKIFTTDSIVGRESGTTIIETVERML